MKKKYEIRILKKSKSGVLIKVLRNNQQLELSWDVFNSQFDLVDNYYGIVKPEVDERYKKIRSLAAKGAMGFAMTESGNNRQKVTGSLILSECVNSITELAGWTEKESIAVIKDYIDECKKMGIIYHPITFDKSESSPNPSNSLKSNVPVELGNTRKPTIGDLPQCRELMEKFNR